MDLQTTHGETYQGMGGNPAQKVRHEPQIASSSRTKFTGQTQSSKDYPGYHGRQPRPPAAMEPSEPTIQLRFNNRWLCIGKDPRSATFLAVEKAEAEGRGFFHS